jgi:hypothetical protein
VAAPAGPLDFAGLDAIVRAIMRRDLENQWLTRVDGIAGRLVTAGLLEPRSTEAALPLLRRQFLTQVMFWVPAAVAAAPDRDPARSLDLHARAALALFLPYCTPAGRKQLEPLLRP